MAYIPLNPADIVAGKPTKEEIFQQIRENEEALNDEVNLLQGSSRVDMFNIKFSGHMDDYSLTNMTDAAPVYRCMNSGSIVELRIVLLEASTSGTIEIMVQNSLDNGQNWNDILNTDLVLTGTSVGTLSPNPTFVTDPSAFTFAQGDLFRIIFISKQTGQGHFQIQMYGENA